jgi:hypothetical protein
MGRLEATMIIVAVPDHRQLRRWTLLSFIRQSQFQRAMFEE